jgi:hypothetical protein
MPSSRILLTELQALETIRKRHETTKEFGLFREALPMLTAPPAHRGG